MDAGKNKTISKKRGRGRPEGAVYPDAVLLRLPEGKLDAIDKWASRQIDKPTRSEAIRRLVDLGLLAKGPSEMKTRSKK